LMARIPGFGRQSNKEARRHGVEEIEPAAATHSSLSAKQNRGIRLCLLVFLSPCLLVCASCAPVDSPDDKKASVDAGAPVTAERIALAGSPSIYEGSSAPAGNDMVLKERIKTVIDQVRQRELLLNTGFWT